MNGKTTEPDDKRMRELCTAAVETFGEAIQFDVAIEELAELIVALEKRHRGPEGMAEFIEEAADVTLMIHQIRNMLGVDDGEWEAASKSKYGVPGMSASVPAEAIKQLCKHRRGFDNRAAIVDSLVDVEIGIGYLKSLYGIDDDRWNETVDAKVARAWRRIRAGRQDAR